MTINKYLSQNIRERPTTSATKQTADITIIGGSGLYQMADLTNKRRVKVETPVGEPSDDIVLGELTGTTVAFLPRHGQGHKFMPSEVPYHTNIYAPKMLAMRYIILVRYGLAAT